MVAATGTAQAAAAAVAPPHNRTVAWAVTITKDGPFLDGAAVLGHAIRLAHAQSPFRTELVAIVHPEVVVARKGLELLGWRVLERDVPVKVEDIKGEYLRKHIRNNGCCGERELLKLWAYTLVQYHRVVHLDMDSMVLQPVDELFADPGPYSAYQALYTYDWVSWRACRRARAPSATRRDRAARHGLTPPLRTPVPRYRTWRGVARTRRCKVDFSLSSRAWPCTRSSRPS